MYSISDSSSRSQVAEAFRPLTLIELLRWRALNQPQQKAYTFLKDGETEEVSLTYGELDRRARAIATMLQARGTRGARALLLYPPSLEYVAAFFGCLYAEMVAVPAYPPDPSKFSRSLPRLHSIVADAEATVALTTEPLLTRAKILFDESPLLKSLNWASGDNPGAGVEDDWREPPVHRDALAFLQYTSGSTGTPKGVMLSHANLLHNAGLVYHGVEHTTSDSYVSWLPTFHDMGFMAGILQPLYAGIPVVSMSPVAFLQRPFLWLKAITAYRATTSGAPNFAYDLCVRKIAPAQREELDLSAWSVAFNGAEPIRPETMERFVEAFAPCGFRREAFYPCYGLAEATLIVSGSAKSAPPVVKNFDAAELENLRALETNDEVENVRPLVGCGKSLMEQKVVIVHPESLTECLPGEVGEIWVAGGSVALGYWNQPEETEHTFHAQLADTGEGPYLRTGDLGFLNEGELYVTGRLKDLIIIRGRNHYPQDIELTVERSHAALRAGCGAAFSVDVEGEERLVVVQEVDYRKEADMDAVAGIIRAAVAQEHELQTHAIVLLKPGRIPKTTSGKIQRRASRKAFLAGSMEALGEWRANATTAIKPTVEKTSAPVESAESVAAWLALEVATRVGINRESIDANQPVARYGLDSLASIELMHSIETHLGVVLPMASFLQSASIAELASEINERLRATSPTPDATLAAVADTTTAQPLSHGQQALWFLHQLAPESPAYNISAAVRVRAAVDVPALRRAFQQIVNRHPSLRTTFQVHDGEPRQEVRPTGEISFQELNATHWNAELLDQRLVEEANHPFDLESGELLRVSLYRRAAAEYVLLLSVHHIVADFWSLATMMHELGALYTAERTGQPAMLAHQTLQYTDYVRWQKQMLAGEEGERLWQYWQEQLSGELPVLDLPTDRPRPQIQTYRGDSFSFKLDNALRDKLKELGQSSGTTLHMNLLAVFQLMLHRYTNQETLLVGTPTAGRNRAELAGVVGYFVNPVVLRADLSGNPTFEEYLSRVRATSLGALAHQDYPFPLLVERLQPERDASRSPLVQVMFALQKAHLPSEQSLAAFSLGEAGARMKLGELPLESLALPERVAQFDLTLMMSEEAEGLAASLQYNRDLFDRPTIERMAGHFQTLVEAVAANPQSHLSELPLIPAGELEQMLVEWNKTQWEPSDDATVPQLFAAQAARTPEALAVASAQQQLNYQELNARANRVAHYLRGLGVGAETPVAVCMERSVEMVVALLGILKAGGAYLPLDPAYPQERLHFMLRDSGAHALLTQQRLADNFNEYDAPVICLDSDWLTIAQESDADPEGVEASASNLAYIIYTSGSTGEPKGVEIQHAGLSNLVTWHQRAYGITSGDRATQLAGPAFDASVWELWPYLTAGASIHIPDDETRASASNLLQWLAVEAVTICFLPTPLAEMIIEETLPVDLALRAILTGGDVLHRAPRQPLPFVLVNHYGPTENSVVTTRAAVAQATAEHDAAPPIGRPIDNTQTYLLDSYMRPVPPGVPGELHIGGTGLARGYRRRPELTAEKFIPNPFSAEAGARLYRTGDLARYLPDGQIEFLGRLDQQVKIRGFRIELGEIESVLRQHAEVREAVVAAREDVPGNFRLVAYVVAVEGQSPAAIELQSFLKEKLPEHMIPTAFVALDEIPLTPNGKVDRRALPAPHESASELDTPDGQPRTPVEELLAGICAQVLGLKRVRLHDNFFALGGHSLLATQVISRVRQAFQVEIPLHSLFASPTVAGLAVHVEEFINEGRPSPSTPLVPVLRDSELPLSFAQQRLWFLDQLEPLNPLYNIPAAINLRGPLDVSALEQSLNEIVRRHEALRTNFKSSDGQPVQIISAPQPFDLPVNDLRHLAGEEKQAQSFALIAAEARLPFDLSTGPLLRAGLLRLDEEDYVMTLTLHHIIADGWSMGVFVQELSALYEAFAQGKPSPLAELPIQYADYAAWQREWLEDEMLDAQLAYWKQQLADAPAALELPVDRPRPPVQSFRGAHQTLTLPRPVSDGLKALSRREGVTLFMTLLAAFQTLLSRYSGQKDIVVGTPIAGRNRVEIESLIGFFVNTLVLRTDLSANPTFAELLSQVREVVLTAHAHQDVPFEKLVDALQAQRDLSRSPLFQVMFVLQNATQYPHNLADVDMTALSGDTTTAKFDLTLHMEETRHGLTARLEYSTDLYEAATIHRLLRHLEQLLSAVVDNPSLPLSQLSLLTPDEAQQLLVAWNDTTRPYPSGESLHQLFEQQVARTPHSLALVAGAERLTYAALNERANQLAHHLLSLGVAAESRVGIMLERSATLLVSLLAVHKAGGAYVPLDPAYPHERLSFMLADADVRVLLTEAHLIERVPSGHAAQVVALDDIADELATLPTTNPQSPVLPDNLSHVIYTSGSTGVPKGVAIAHGSSATLLHWAQEEFSAGQLAGVLAATSINFDLSVFELFVPLSCGGTVLLVENALALAEMEQPERERVTLINTVPSAMTELVRLRAVPPTVQVVNLAGEALSARLVGMIYEASPQVEVVNLYGPSEDTTYSTCAHVGREAVARGVTIGRPIANTAVYLLDEQMRPVPVGVSGELYLAGAGLARGYLNRPMLTAERFVPHPYSQSGGERLYRTGDLARYRADGEIEYIGRADTQVKVRGYRIELGEVEAALCGQAGVKDAVAVVKERAGGERMLVAYVVAEDGTEVSASGIREGLRRVVPDYMIPQAVIALAEMPLTPNGKVDRGRLPEVEGGGEDRGEREYVEPKGEVEAEVAGIWSEVLGIERVGAEDNFFAAGGHSLLATQVVSRVREAFKVDIPLRSLFEEPTVAGLAGRIQQMIRAEAGLQLPPLRQVARAGEIELSYAQQRLWFLDQLEPGSPFYNIPAAVQLEGVLNISALEESFNRIVQRHEALRTRFTSVDGRPSQVIDDSLRVKMDVVELNHLPEAERRAATLELAREEAQRPFNLTRGPLLRASVVRLEESAHVLLVTMHHIISDGWSIGVLMREVAALYEAFAQGQPSPLAELPIQYADYAAWQREWLQGEVLEQQLGYWRERLAGAPAMLELPTDRPRPAVQSFHGATESIALSESLSESLKALSRRQGVTLFTTLLAAFKTLLSRYSGQKDIVVGTPVANRNQLETEELIGCFVNTLVLRTDLSGDPTFKELLKRTWDAAMGAYAHQDVPFEKLVDALQAQRDLSRSPLFQVMFVLQNATSAKIKLPGLNVNLLETDSGTSRFDLTLSLSETERGIVGTLEYSTDLYEAATIHRLLRHLEQLLSAVVDNPSLPLSQLSLLTPDEAQQLLVAWNDTSRPYPSGESLHQLFEQQVARTPDALALVCNGEQLSYTQLNERANQLAHHLLSLGVAAESRVGIMLERSATLLVSLLAVHKAGGAYVPLDPAYPHERLSFMLSDADVKVLLTQSHLIERVPSGHAAQVIALDTLADELATRPTTNPQRRVLSQNLSHVIYTSGSTGVPKGVAIAHGSSATLVHWAQEEFSAGQLAGVLASTSINFDLSVFELFVPLSCGGTVLLVENALALAEMTEPDKERVTLINTVPSAMTELVRLRAVPPTVQVVNLAGEALSARLVGMIYEASPQVEVVNLYGPSEDTTYSTCAHVGREALTAGVTIGRPIANTAVYILDEQMRPVPVGVSGELYLAGAGLARGYLNRPMLTAERFVPHPYSQSGGERLYRTGDLARYRGDGEIEYIGRADTQVKVRGYRIELGEVEAALCQQAGVRDAVAVVKERAGGERMLVAYVVAEDDAEVSVSRIREGLRRVVPEYMIPQALVTLTEMPLTPNGKVDRGRLPEVEGGGGRGEHGGEREYVEPKGEVEEEVAGIWSEVLGVERVGAEDNFFAAGGHSLLATQIVSRMRAAFQVDVPLRAVFESPTVAGLSRKIEIARGAGARQQIPAIAPVTRDGEIELSYAQQRLWFLDQLEPGSPFYNIPAAVRLEGVLNISALEESFNRIVQRHEALRTNFVTHEGRPAQMIAKSLRLSVPVLDLREIPDESRETEVRRLILEESRRPFDLSSGPLLRASVVRLEENAHVLLVTMHHIISDGWSIGVLMREVAALYEAFAQGQPSPLAELPIQYADYAAWQREWLQGEVLEQQLGYWRERLAGAPAMLELPTDHPRPAVQNYEGARSSLALSTATTNALKSFSQSEELTLFVTLLAAFKTLLSRYSGQQDIVVGTPVANRNQLETEELIGCFVNTLVLRTDLSANPTFRELAAQVGETVLEAQAHQDVPFEKLVDALQAQRDLSRSPLFQVMFVLQNAATETFTIPDLSLTGLEVDSGTAKFDLTLFITETPEGLACSLEYNTDLFEAATAARFLASFHTLLDSIVAHPDQRITNLPLLTPDEAQQLLVAWNDTSRPYPSGESLHQLFEQQVARTPDALALVAGAERLSYAELDERANQLAHHLLSLGVAAETRVGIMLERSATLLVSLLAVHKAGGAYVPLDPAYPHERLSFMLSDADVKVLLTQLHLLERVPSEPAAQVIVLDALADELAAQPATNPQRPVLTQNLSHVIYTSGSTGVPKGVAIAHGSSATLLHWAQEEFTPRQLSGVLASTSINFDLSVFELFVPLSCGGTVLLVENALSLLEMGERDKEHVTLINTVPSAMTELVRLRAVPPTVQVVNLAGEALSARLVGMIYEASPQVKVVNLYGPSEDTTYSTCAHVGREAVARGVTIGRPIANTQVYIFDAEMRPVPVGVSGELYISGAGLARGYLNRPMLTAERFVPHPYSQSGGERLYRTGDLARYRGDGEIEYIGRADTQVKVRGYRIELGEVEAALCGQAGVKDAVAVVKERAGGERMLVAYVVAEEGTEVSVSGIRAGLRRVVPDYMIPQALVTLTEMPLTPNGKVDRGRLPEVEGGGGRGEHGGEREYVEPKGEVEAEVAGIWSEVLGVERVGAEDNFFAAGGHSLLAAQVMFAVRERFKVELPLRTLFESPTVAELAAAIEKVKGNATAAIAPLARERYRVKGSARRVATLPEGLRKGQDV